jgi:hypothetical protein
MRAHIHHKQAPRAFSNPPPPHPQPATQHTLQPRPHTCIAVTCTQGSHRIETLLYRDNNITAAVPWAEQLVADYKALVGKLKSPSEYSAPQIFAGIIEVAREVAKKKISSEEETWSDQSVLIFYNNLQVCTC